MLDSEKKNQLSLRLNKISGQIRGISAMISDDRYCMDILSQTRAVAAAIKKVENIIMENHLKTCVTDSMSSSDKADQDIKIQEIMTLLERFRKGN